MWPKMLFHIIFVVPLSCHAQKRWGLHPIAVGEVLHQLTSKCAARSVLPETLQILSRLQVSVGLPAGCEVILYSISNVHENPDISPNHCFTLLVDFSSAFNSVDRLAIFNEVRSQIEFSNRSIFLLWGNRFQEGEQSLGSVFETKGP